MRALRTHDIQHHDGPSSELRRDTGQRDAVARGIATLVESGVMPAVEYLKAHGVRGQVIERVLLEPDRRRAAA